MKCYVFRTSHSCEQFDENGNPFDWDEKAIQPPCEGAVIEKEHGEPYEDLHWIIKLHSLDELERFIIRNGRVILTKSDVFNIVWEIEIYDDYRE